MTLIVCFICIFLEWTERKPIKMSWKKSTASAYEVGLFDAHCHPTQLMSEVKQIETMKTKVLTIMATREVDQELVVDVAKQYPVHSKDDISNGKERGRVVPAFGWHPWMSHHLYDDRNSNSTINHDQHYHNVLNPSPEDADFLASLPTPKALTEFLAETEKRLNDFPIALVGEVGLDKSFRVPYGPKRDKTSRPTKAGDSKGEYTCGSREGQNLSPHHVTADHQRVILKAQLELAAKMKRAVSVHSVATHGLVFDVLQELWKNHERPSKSSIRKQKKDAPNATASDDAGAEPADLPYPPRICMHSYSGPGDALKQFLSPRVPADMFFSFSECINFKPATSKKSSEVINMLPDDKILIESDLHCAGKTMDDHLEKVLIRVCDIKGWNLDEGAKILRENWIRFVFGP